MFISTDYGPGTIQMQNLAYFWTEVLPSELDVSSYIFRSLTMYVKEKKKKKLASAGNF